MKIKKSLINVYQSVQSFKNNHLPRYFVWNPFMSSLYYLLFSKKFKREQHAVLMGKLRYLRNVENKESTKYLLIRNTHRLEKGLLMRPMRQVFALDYIGETVEAFIKIWKPDLNIDGSQYKWSFDVLSEYFEKTGDHQIINEQRNHFYDFVNDFSQTKNSLQKSIPYKRNLNERPMIEFDQFYNLTKFRRSVRWFLDKSVPRELIDKAILAANQSPSACNRQPFVYRIIDDKKLLKKVANLPGGVKGYVEGIPMIIVVVGNLDAYFDERDRHVIYIDASLANMTLMLALETLGLSSCSINWPDVEKLEIGMEKALTLEKHQRPIMLIAVGYPDPNGKVAYSEKRDLELLRQYN